MGDMAEYALDQTLDAEDDRFQYRTGRMSEVEAYDLGIIDERGTYHHPPMFRSLPVAQTCRYCGAGGLHWKDTGAGYRLANAAGEVHACPQYGF